MCHLRASEYGTRTVWFPALLILGLLTQTHTTTGATEELTPSVCEPADQPISCRCDEVRDPGMGGGTEVTCFVVRTLSADHAVFKSLERLPSVVAVTFTAFGEKYKLDFVPSVFLRRKPLLQRLKFSQAELGSLKSHSFYNLSKLAVLSLDSNGITQLQKDSIAHLPRLRKLELGDNKLERLTTRSFTHLPLLTYLFLERNQIEVIEDLAFTGLSKLKELDLSDNAMTNLTERTFEGLSQVKRLDLFRNKLRRLDARVFGAMPLLSELDLKYNEISEVDPVAFDGLAHLTVLYLSHNRLRVLPANMFVGAPNLVTVDLSQNRLLTLTWRTVEDLRKIGAESFDMSLTGANELDKSDENNPWRRETRFPALLILGLLTQTHTTTGATEELTPSVCEPADQPISCRCDEVRDPGMGGGTEVTCFVVRTLSADHAVFKSLERLPSVVAVTFTAFGEKYKLDFVPSVFLRRKPLLQRLKFSQAELGSLKSHSFYNLSKLAVLSLDSNGITQLQKDSIAHLPRLRKLELGDNKLERLTTRSFTHLPLLTYLFLERNQIEVIEDLAFTGLSKLKELDLSDNAMTNLTERTFEGLSQVKRLDLFRNKLRRLDARVFGAMPLLSELDLKYNEISEVDPVAFDGLAHLTVLYLSHNRLRVLPANMFVGAPNLVTVDLSQNRLLTLTWRTVEDLRKIGAESFDMSLTASPSLAFLWSATVVPKVPALLILGLLTQTHTTTGATEELDPSVCEPADQPISCRCDEVRDPGMGGGTEVTCFVVRTLSADHAVFKSLERLPSVVAVTFTAFGEKYKLDFVPSVFLRRKPLLQRLKFSQAELGSLKSHSFYNLSKLAVLSLDSNGITQLQKDSIAHLPRLRKLELGDNKLERLTTRSFTHLPLLTYLFLERNQIEVIEDLAFTGLSKLKELDLSDNAMTNLTERTFEGLSQVKRLDLFRNKLRQLDARVFGAMPLLSELDLKYNEISEVDPVAFDGLAHLTVLYLSHNRLRVLPANMFVGAPNLVTVDLSQNRLLTLTWRTVEDLRKIGAESFDMSLTGEPLLKKREDMFSLG
ncbi:insulin-like growth factor-binding protein complex acid labile subunit [Ixodes scapularis]